MSISVNGGNLSTLQLRVLDMQEVPYNFRWLWMLFSLRWFYAAQMSGKRHPGAEQPQEPASQQEYGD